MPLRNARGVYMLELIMAIAASGLIALALVGSMSETHEFSTAGQNQILAACIVQEQIDNARNTSFEQLDAMRGTHTLLVNKENSGQVGPAVNPRPVLLDMADLSWTPTGQKNKFNGTVTETVAYDATYPQMLRVTVSCDWNEGNRTKNYTLATLISRYGIHN